MTDVIIILIVLAIVVGAGAYVYKAKKSGKKCIGCPEGASCSGGCGCSKTGDGAPCQCGKDA